MPLYDLADCAPANARRVESTTGASNSPLRAGSLAGARELTNRIVTSISVTPIARVKPAARYLTGIEDWA